MTTGQAWIDETRGVLLSGQVEELNRLDAAYTAGGTSLSFEFPLKGVQPGVRLCIGRNTFHVWETSGTTATVSGGQEGSVDANASVGDVVRVKPRFTDDDIFRALNFDLHDLSSPESGLFQVVSKTFTYDSVVSGYDMSSVSSDVLSVIEVRYETVDDSKLWPRVHTDKYRLSRSVPSTDFSSGLALMMYEPGNQGYSIYVTFRAPFTQLSTTGSTKASTGLRSSAWDLPPLGAAIYLLSGREVKRNFTESQGDVRRASEVMSGSVTRSAVGLREQRRARLLSERNRLEALHPLVKDM